MKSIQILFSIDKIWKKHWNSHTLLYNKLQKHLQNIKSISCTIWWIYYWLIKCILNRKSRSFFLKSQENTLKTTYVICFYYHYSMHSIVKIEYFFHKWVSFQMKFYTIFLYYFYSNFILFHFHCHDTFQYNWLLKMFSFHEFIAFFLKKNKTIFKSYFFRMTRVMVHISWYYQTSMLSEFLKFFQSMFNVH